MYRTANNKQQLQKLKANQQHMMKAIYMFYGLGTTVLVAVPSKQL